MTIIWGLPLPLLSLGACVLLVAAGWLLGFEAGKRWVFRAIARNQDAWLARNRRAYDAQQRAQSAKR